MGTFYELYASLSTVDCLRSLALIVAFLATAFADKKGDGRVWLLADQIVNFAFGIGVLIFPNTLLANQVTQTLTPMNQYLSQLIGLIMIGAGVIWFTSSRDNGSAAAWSLARMLSSGTVAHVMIYHSFLSRESGKIMTKQHQSFAILGALLLTLGHAMCAFRTLGTALSRNPLHSWSRRNVALLVFLVLVTIDVFINFGFPDMSQEQLTEKYRNDQVNLYLLGVAEAILMSYMFYGFTALTSLGAKEGTAVMLAGLVVYGMFFPIHVYYQNKYHFFLNSANTFALGVAGLTCTVCLSGTWEWFMGDSK